MRDGGARSIELAICFVPVKMQEHMLQHMSMQNKWHKARMGLRRVLRCVFCVVWRLRLCAARRRRRRSIALHSIMLLQKLIMLCSAHCRSRGPGCSGRARAEATLGQVSIAPVRA